MPPRTWSWTGDGVLVQAEPGSGLRDGDLVTAIDGVALGGDGGWWAPARRPGDRLVYQVVRDGETRAVPVVLGRVDLAGRLVQAWGTILFVVLLFGVVAYLYARRPGPATGGLLVLARHRGLLWVVWRHPGGAGGRLGAGRAGRCRADPVGGSGHRRRDVHRRGRAGPGIVVAMVRYLTATDPIGRQQLKWLAGGAFISGGLALVAGLTVAVLRYRLFDVDRIISRTLAWVLLTVLLGGGYALVVRGCGQLLGRDSSLVVAAAILAVAALFQPARRRVQALVDRRFNRRHYDTTQTIAAFSARLREQIDLDTLSTELLAVAEQTMQPTQVSLWLRHPAGASQHQNRMVGRE